ncbi:MAG: S8 family serine peptidase, partial [Eubacteriales bacterium]|nr:S8 family serine peptidase [Eubacteriales bacterium]
MNEKMENILNVAKELPEDELEKSAQLSAGFDVQEDLWEVIVRFSGDPAFLREYPEVSYAVLSNNFAILKLPAELIDTVADHPNIIYMEKPKPLYFSVAANRSEACVNSVQNQFGLYGEGVLIAVIDSGIDYAHPAFLTPEGRTRIRAIWDQTEERGEPPTTLFEVRGSRSPIRGSEYTAEQINEALSADQDSYTVVSSFDRSGHGTHVAGIAAGNFANDRRNQVGFATKSELLVVKLALPQERSFPTTVELMEAIDYSVRKAVQMKMPLVINLSFGNNYGSH